VKEMYQEKSFRDMLLESLQGKPKTTNELAYEFNVSRDVIYHTLEPLKFKRIRTKMVYAVDGRGHKQVLWSIIK
jgi:predicted transcriptional regulator